MRDQANQLRNLVEQETRLTASASRGQPVLVAVTAGKGGVGATTIALNLSVVLTRLGHRTLLVDADLDGADASLLCRVEERYTVADVLSGRRTVREVLQPGPGGIQVLPGAWGLARPPDDSSPARQRLVEGLKGLGSQVGVIVADAGSGLRPMVGSLWRAADLVLIVSTPELPSVMDTYASIKVHSTSNLLVPIHLLVNQAPDESGAEDAHGRISTACLRLLAVPVTRAGHVVTDPQVAACGREGTPLSISAPRSAAAVQLEQLGRFVAAQFGAGTRPCRPAGCRVLRPSIPVNV